MAWGMVVVVVGAVPAGVRGGVVYGACLPRLTGTGAVTLCHLWRRQRPAGGQQFSQSPVQQAPAFGCRKAVLSARPPRLASEFCLVACHPCISISTLSLRPAIRTNSLTHPQPQPQPHPHRHKTDKTERGEREGACIGLYSILVCSNFRRCLFTLRLVVLSLSFPLRCLASGVWCFWLNKVLWLALTPSHSSLSASAASLGFFQALTVITI